MTDETRPAKPRPKNLSLSAEVLGLLEQVGERKATEYVERLVRDRWQEWQDALGLLIGEDMTTNEIIACCDILNGHYHVAGTDPGQSVSLSLHDGQALDRTAQKHGCDLERWRLLVLRVREFRGLGEAILTVSREFWSDNEACNAAIRRVDRARAGSNP